MRLPEGTDGSPGARATEAASNLGAQTPLTEVSPVRDVIRDLENTALSELDVLAARRLTEVDRRFERAAAKLYAELARRQDAEPQNRPTRHPVTMDASAFVAASVGVGVLLAGNRSGPSIPTDGALVAAMALGVLAVVLHAASWLRAARTRASTTQSWYFLIFSTVLLFGSAAIGYWRFSSDPEAGFITTAIALGVLISSGVFTAVLVARGSRERASESLRKAALDNREEKLRADLRASLAELTTVCRTEAERVFDGLGAPVSVSLDAAVEAGIEAVEKRGILETAAIRDLRTSRRGELRYDVAL